MTFEVRPAWPGEVEDGLFVRRAAGADVASRAVLVHGLGGSSTNWTDLMGLLQDTLDCAAPDLPGFGHSPPPPLGDYSLEAHARAIITYVARQPGGPVHLVGNSLGGAIATIVAARRPDLVRTLTLVSPALPVLRPRRTNAHLPALAMPWLGQRLAHRLGRYPVDARVRASIALCFADPGRVASVRFDDAIAEAERRAHLPYDTESMLASLRSLMAAYLHLGQVDLWRVAAQVRVPTLLVYGLADKLVDPRSSARAARTFPDNRLLLLPDSGHVAQMEHPEDVAAAVRRHVSGVSRTDARRYSGVT